MRSAEILRQKINSGQVTVGMLCTFHFWPDLIESARNTGLDYLIIDLEHLGHNQESVATACAIGRMIDFPILIRPPESVYTHVRLAADLGPCGFLLPQIRSVATLNEVRDGLYMPPRGLRRPGGPGNRWVKDYQYTTWKTEQEDQWVVLPQIESQEGLNNVNEIARHELTTAIAIGPYDLSANLGVCWQPDSPKLQGAIQKIREAGKAAGKNMWMIGDGAALRKQGFTFLCVGEPIFAMEEAFRNKVAAAKTGVGSESGEKRPLP